MTTPEVVRCPDSHFRRAIWDLGLYIAYYPKQTLLSCIVRSWCARCRVPPSKLDGPDSQRPRTEAITEVLIKTQTVASLWSDHGIIVCSFQPYRSVS
ncbi:hypothetical protein F5887DRAFT_957895 [Amanita rubescens]|nr:hypothetical protein F5887DRAFT_957895 [Amanita rubescens]